MQKNYGHLLRDNVLYIYYFLKRAKLLDKEYELYISTDRYGFHHGSYKQFILDIFPQAKILAPPNRTNGWTLPEEESLAIEGARNICTPNKMKKCWKNNRFYWYRTEALNHYPKYCVDSFRDYCFNQYNFEPVVKKRLLYVPRQDPRECKHDFESRFLRNPQFVKELKSFCKTNGYEFLHWVNNVSVFEQIKAYSESDIIVGVQGTDWINSFWTNENQLLLEIVPPKSCASADVYHYPFDINSMFYSEHLQDYAKETRLDKWYKFNPKQKRNWQTVLTENCKEISPSAKEVILSVEERLEALQKIQSHISLSKDNS